MLHCLALKKIPLVCYSLAFTKLHDYKKKKKQAAFLLLILKNILF